MPATPRSRGSKLGHSLSTLIPHTAGLAVTSCSHRARRATRGASVGSCLRSVLNMCPMLDLFPSKPLFPQETASSHFSLARSWVCLSVTCPIHHPFPRWARPVYVLKSFNRHHSLPETPSSPRKQECQAGQNSPSVLRTNRY